MTAVPRVQTEELEATTLASWATRAASSKGRERPEEAHPLRTDFQRDRDRILHTKAFRRLMHKTQVFLAPEGDHYRTRLTHTLEVAQVARTICRALRLNEDLVEAICLGHDIGHTPFGHVGEEILGEVMGRPFEHNRQSLRLVDHLERDGEGLNLTWEVRDGILNHTWRMDEPSTPEGMVARWADRIAYVSHDVDDSVRAGVLSEDDLPERVRRVLGPTYRERLDKLVRSIVGESSGAEAIVMPDEEAEAMGELRSFLFERVYLGPVRAEAEKTGVVLRELCNHFRNNPDDLPPSRNGDDVDQRVIDYVSGMTDRFALRMYRERFLPKGIE
ncbi:MAG TPA: deoxyguanosinetriphosphate triphosphohydrolase [Actinomycetota bacterium]|jgi:dGTPase|nr:deoxyguanosinetriphosphate triphosphohydrolase [Actinomycetota bacterium]